MIPPLFERREITIRPGETIAPDSDWDDAIVVVEEGEIELVGRHGATLRVEPRRRALGQRCGVALVAQPGRRIDSPLGGATGTISAVCLNCLSTAEAAIAQTVFLGYVVKDPVHRALARAGLVGAPDPAARDARTVAFLTSLDLDPVEILGRDRVDAAAASIAPQRAPIRWRLRSRLASSARPIGSHSLLTAQ